MKIFSYRYLPLNIYSAFTCFTIASLMGGPVIYKEINYTILLAYIAMLMIIFSIGYIWGAKGSLYATATEGTSNAENKFKLYLRIRPLFRLLIICSIASFIIQWYSFVISGGVINIEKMGESYINSYANYERGQAQIGLVYILNIFNQSLVSMTLLFGIYYIKNLNNTYRWMFVFIIVSYLLIYVVALGKQKYFGDLIVFIFFFIFINQAAQRRRQKYAHLISISMLCLVAFIVFVEILNQRYMAVGIGLHNISEKAHPLISWDQTSIFFDVFGEKYGFAIGVFQFYFTNGLYGLSLCLQLPFEWTYFVGNSYSLSRVLEILSGDSLNIVEYSYPYRAGVELGWGADKWHSLFAWLASDITFIGVLVLTLFFARFYAKLWIEAIRSSNPFSGPLFIYFSLGLVFSYANNQLMHTLESVIVLFCLLLGRLYSNMRKI